MRRKLRPILLVTLVSFLLGLWLSLRNAEHDLLQRLREAPVLTILTDQPDWWQSVARRAEYLGIAKLELVHPARRSWGEILNPTNSKCDLLTVKSYFLRHFSNKKWLESVRDNSPWWELLHPDFQDTPATLHPGQYLPLLWSVTTWQVSNPTTTDGRLELKTSLDDALLVAIDLHETTDDFNESQQIDNQETAEQLWNYVKENISMSFNQPETNIPLKPVKAVQTFVTEAQEKNSSDSKLSHNDLWTWGLGVCPGHRDNKALNDFIVWLLEPQNMALMAQDSRLGLTTMSGEHNPVSLLRPSNLRGFKLENLRRRELSWDLSSAWEDLLTQKSNTSPAKR